MTLFEPALELEFTVRDGVLLAHDVRGCDRPTPNPPMVFLHGWCCDHRFFMPQLSHFAGSHCVLAPDLRGHGRSDAPRQDYTVAGFADDVAWQMDRLGLRTAAVVGHSLGGNVVLELAARRPDLVSAAIMIDSALFTPPDVMETLREAVSAFESQDHRRVMKSLASGLFLETDCAERKAQIIETMANAKRHVMTSAFANHVFDWVPPRADQLKGIRLTYVASTGLADYAAVRRAYPDMCLLATSGCGHFSPLEAPSQVNALIEKALEPAISA